MTILEKTEGIVLRSFEYQERARILSLFTQEAGLISLIVKRSSEKNFRLLSLTSCFSCGEFIYRKGNTDLYRFEDGSLLDEHLYLRHQWSHLETAGVLARAILRSQLPGKPAPLLYALFRSYLKQIPGFEAPQTLLASFTLKLLFHEGLLDFEKQPPLLQQLLLIRSFEELKKISLSPALFRESQELFSSTFGLEKGVQLRG